ncbi:Conserved_hypothetical protein [Hexamita inflata]|uniref:Uncharacterized protein n=1 Tax=Hexamita inflata TaxID=28002 RepID=A0ABP1IYY4_9EUKA
MEQDFSQLQSLMEEAEQLMSQFSTVHDEIETNLNKANINRQRKLDIVSNHICSPILNPQKDPHLQEDIDLDEHLCSLLQETDYIDDNLSVIENEPLIQPLSMEQPNQNLSYNTSMRSNLSSAKYSHIKSSYAQQPPKLQPKVEKVVAQPPIKNEKPKINQKLENKVVLENKSQVQEQVEFDDNFEEEVGGVEVMVEPVMVEPEPVEVDQALMTEIDPKYIMDVPLVESVLEDDYFEKVKNGYKIPTELQDLDNSENEKLSQYGDGLSFMSSTSTTTVNLDKPKLTKQTDELWQRLHIPQGQIDLVIPKVKGQPDFLRELKRDRMLSEYMKGVDQCLKSVRAQRNRPINEDELTNLLQEAQFEAEQQPKQRIDLLFKEIEDDVIKLEQNGYEQNEQGEEYLSLMEKMEEQEKLQTQIINKEQVKFEEQMKLEEQLKKKAKIDHDLNLVSKEALKITDKKRVGSAKAVIQTKEKIVYEKYVPKVLKGVGK